jgi:hypothetical protein
MIEDLIRATQSAAGGRSLFQLLQDFGQPLTNYKNRVRGVNVPIQQRSVVNPEFLRPDYSGAGERARRLQEYQTGRDIPGANTDYSVRLGGGSPGASQGGGFGGGQYQGAGSFAPIDPYAAQNREYERERARVEAMVKANPDMQKQAIADERAKVRDQGMAIWAAANPTLAKQVKPGAVGYDAIQQVLIGKDAGQASRQAFGYQTPQQITLTPPPGVNTPQGFPAVQSIQPAEAYTTEGLQLDPEMRLKFQSLLNLTNK